MTREAWLRARQGEDGEHFLGGSDAATILGWSTWEDPIGLWGRKLGLIKRDDTDTEAAEAGRVFEDTILEWYSGRTKRRIIRPSTVAWAIAALRETEAGIERDGQSWLGRYRDVRHFVQWSTSPATPVDDDAWSLYSMMSDAFDVHYGPDEDGQVIFRSKSRRYALLTPDAFALDRDLGGWGVVDAKNLNRSKLEAWADGIPPDKSPQVAFYTRDAPFAWGGFAVVFGGQMLRAYDMTRSTMTDLHELLDVECAVFLEALATETRPGAAASPGSRDALRKLYPSANPNAVRGWAGLVRMADGTTWAPQEFDEEFVANEIALRSARDTRAKLEAVLLEVADGAGTVRLPNGSTFTFSRGIRRRGAR